MDDKLELSCYEFLNELKSSAPVPGGGGASALAGALAAALGCMVGNLTTGKKKYAAVEEDIKKLIAESNQVMEELAAAVTKDAKAFEPLSKLYSMPKDAEGRGELLEAALRDAAAAPFEILGLCCRVIELQKEFAEKGSVLAISDAATGAALAAGAARGAAINVRVNTKLMTDRAYAEELNAKVDALLSKYCVLADEVYLGVCARM